jgi:hypothetical protein
MRDTMMLGVVRPGKCTASVPPSGIDESELEATSTDPSLEVSVDAGPSKCTRLGSRRKASDQFGKLVDYMGHQDKHRKIEVQHMEKQEMLQERMVEIAERAVELQVVHQGNLLALLRETLGGGGGAAMLCLRFMYALNASECHIMLSLRLVFVCGSTKDKDKWTKKTFYS